MGLLLQEASQRCLQTWASKLQKEEFILETQIVVKQKELSGKERGAYKGPYVL